MVESGDPLTQEEMNDLMKIVDLDCDGMVNYEEFLKLMRDIGRFNC